MIHREMFVHQDNLRRSSPPPPPLPQNSDVLLWYGTKAFVPITVARNDRLCDRNHEHTISDEIQYEVHGTGPSPSHLHYTAAPLLRNMCDDGDSHSLPFKHLPLLPASPGEGLHSQTAKPILGPL